MDVASRSTDSPLVAIRATPVGNGQDAFYCPGASHAIDRSLHLARLASFYPACRECSRRDETGSLARVQVENLSELEQHSVRAIRLGDEAFEGVYLNELGGPEVRQVVQAFAKLLWQQRTTEGPPVVVVANDGRWLSAQLVAAACQQLRLGLCNVLETDPLTAAAVARAVVHFGASGGLLVGNPAGRSHAVGIKLWGQLGSCWSAADGLEQVRTMLDATFDRPGRGYGGLERAAFSQTYLERFAGCFHGLRPLRVVLDTACSPLLSHLSALSGQSACEFLTPRLERQPPPRMGHGLPPISSRAEDTSGDEFLDMRLASLAAEVRRAEAHLGVWIDGDAERCRFVDEQGSYVPWLNVLVALDAQRALGETMVCEQGGHSANSANLAMSFSGRLHVSSPSRQAIVKSMLRCGASLGADSQGRFYFGNEPPAADALEALLSMLSLLSQSDAPASHRCSRPQSG